MSVTDVVFTAVFWVWKPGTQTGTVGVALFRAARGLFFHTLVAIKVLSGGALTLDVVC